MAPPRNDSVNLTLVEKMLQDLSTMLDRMRQPASLAVKSEKEDYEPYS